MEIGAQPGNQNAAKGKIWAAAIHRALKKRSKVDMVEALDALAEKLLEQCDEGELSALRELGDRLDGKSHQSVAVANPDGTALFSEIARVIVDGKK
jgi:hypothetical protein